MSRAKPDRIELLSSMAAHVLKHGLNTASLRPLAKAAGTSDRMLIYHFGSKDGLIAELLEHLAGTMAVGLSTALPERRAPTVGQCVSDIAQVLRQPEFQPFSNIWFDIVSASAQGSDLHRATAERIITGFLAWIEPRLPETVDDPAATARFALTLIEGILVMDAVGQETASDAALSVLAGK